ncbi:hypothetical protein EGW08_005564 [Elysia chlorotica]|uniref:BLOC-1 subunit 6 n=1 Tax=Elysia chlorotica TaxID=188477 RepID=A0A3S0ZZ86_ELYCH|nr:hypothetical protein EGW08_005564 [Elysia chlorotica]
MMNTEEERAESDVADQSKFKAPGPDSAKVSEFEKSGDNQEGGKTEKGEEDGEIMGEEGDLPADNHDRSRGQHEEGKANTDSLPEVKVLDDIKSLRVEESAGADPAVVELLTSGFVERFLPGLRKSQAAIDQIRTSQGVLLDTVQQEIAKFRDCNAVKDVEDTMVKARHYHNKLLRLRREMTNLHEKSRKLKKRALKLQQQKQTEELTRAHTREHELEAERMLTARLATSPSSPL